MRPAALAIAAALLAACSSGQTASRAQGGRSPAIDRAELSAPGVLRTCTDLASPPFAFRNRRSGTPTGFEVELVERVGGRLGLRVGWVVVPRRQFSAALKARRCDLVASRLGYDLDTQLVLDVAALQYVALPLTLVVPAGQAARSVTMADLCGRDLAVVAWTAPAFDAVEQREQCRRAGEPRLRIREAPTSGAALRLVRAGRADAVFDDALSAARLVGGGFHAVEVTDRKGYVALSFRRPGLSTRSTLRGALLALYDDGVVRRLVRRWGLEGKATLLPLP